MEDIHNTCMLYIYSNPAHDHKVPTVIRHHAISKYPTGLSPWSRENSWSLITVQGNTGVGNVWSSHGGVTLQIFCYSQYLEAVEKEHRV